MVKIKSQAQPKRAACDQCRRRKAKCTGELGSCSRCQEQDINCSYSAQRQRGRPRMTSGGMPDPKPMTLEDAELSYIVPSAVQTGPDIESPFPIWNGQDFIFSSEAADQDLDFGELDAGLVPDGQQHGGQISGTESADSFLPLTFVPPAPKQPAPPICNCLPSLFQSIDTVRRVQQPEFPSSLRILREVVQNASSIVECQICPLSFTTASQNALLVGTLAISVAQTYNQLTAFIEVEEKRCAGGNLMKTLQLGELSSPADPCSDTLAFETTPEEWKNIAMKTLKAQIYGVSEQRSISFNSFLEKLKEWQLMWHSGICFEYPEPDHQKVGQSPCLTLIDEAERTMKRLKLES